EAIDHYAQVGQSGFVTRSLTLDRMLAQPGWASAPVKLSMVGPTPQAAGSSSAHNRETFISLVSDLTGLPVDQDMVARTRTCRNYLLALAGEPVDEPAPARRLTRRIPAAQPSSPWPWLVAILAVVLLLAAGLWFWNNTRGSAWEGAEAQLQETYPQLISEREGGKGWKDLECESAALEPGQTAKIRCADENSGVSIASYSTAADRNAGLPSQDQAVTLGSGECMIDSFAVPGVSPPAFVMAPRDQQHVWLLINGENAEAERLDLPLCPGQ
ncbi:MAG: hypothetical protein SPK16_01545, partial [Corynebacterium sp.]|nr:hypothetical protein [Corynebacterium sp.]